MLVTRSSGSLRKLCVSGIPNDPLFSFIADHAGALQTLEIPRSAISDSVVVQVAKRLSSVTLLDISYCRKIGADSIKAFGRHCKSLVRLRRVMHPRDAAEVSQDDVAHAIARTMPNLKHLDLAFSLVTTECFLDIHSSCKDLNYLDIRGCWEVKHDVIYLPEIKPSLKILGPFTFMDSMSDDTDSTDYELLNAALEDSEDPFFEMVNQSLEDWMGLEWASSP